MDFLSIQKSEVRHFNERRDGKSICLIRTGKTDQNKTGQGWLGKHKKSRRIELWHFASTPTSQQSIPTGSYSAPNPNST
jgi:hypothetical protein